jgi:dolichol kinase
MTSETILQREFVRRTIHISGILVPLISIIIGKTNTVVILVALSIIYSASEYLRAKGRALPIINRITENAIRSEEKTSRFAFAPLALALGASASLLIFPTPINYASIVIVSIGDAVASTAGGAVGRSRIPYNSSKSIQGTVIGLVAAFAVSLLFVSPILALVGSVVGMLVESLPLRVNDNITIPILAGTAMVAVNISGVIG